MILKDIYKQIPSSSSCPPSCGLCCGILWPSMVEIRNVREWCIKHNHEFKDFHMLVGLDCPYLGSKKECTIYPVRPFLCRIVAASVSIPCPIGKCKAEKLLSHAKSRHLYKEIYLRGKQKPLTEKHRFLVNKVFAEHGF